MGKFKEGGRSRELNLSTHHHGISHDNSTSPESTQCSGPGEHHILQPERRERSLLNRRHLVFIFAEIRTNCSTAAVHMEHPLFVTHNSKWISLSGPGQHADVLQRNASRGSHPCLHYSPII